MRQNYTGNKPCPGCGRDGSVSPRPYVNEVCYDCRELIRLGKGVKKETERFVRVHYNRDSFIKSCLIIGKDSPIYNNALYYIGNSSVTDSLKDLLQTLHVGNKADDVGTLYIGEAAGRGFTVFYLKEDVAIMLFEFIKTISEYSITLRDNSFNEGKKLLIGLNAGTMTLTDFERS